MSRDRAALDILPDLLRPGLSVVFVGTAAGHTSAERGEYYAGRGNRFWRTLYAVGLTPRELKPSEFRDLPQFGIGLTDIAKTGRGGDEEVAAHHYDVDRFAQAIARCEPRSIAFNGKKSASIALQCRGNRLIYGRQSQRLADIAEVFVLPSTSGAASGYWDILHWHQLASFVETSLA